MNKQYLNHESNARDSGRVSVELDFLRQVAHALQGTGTVLITASAKDDCIHREHPDLTKRLSSVAVLDQPSDDQFVAYGRQYFRADDRMHPQRFRRATSVFK